VSGDSLFSIQAKEVGRSLHKTDIFKERELDTGLLIVADELKNRASIYRIELHTFIKDVFP
jgi:hypothetical protein